MRRSSGTIDGGLAAASQRLVQRSLGIGAGERVVIVHDAAHANIAENIAESVIIAKSEPVKIALEDLGPRPHGHVDGRIMEAMARAQASVLLVDFHAGELRMRQQIVEHAARHSLRHAHMVGVSRASMIAGLSVDPARIAEKGRALTMRLKPDSRLSLRSAAGTDLTVTLSPTCRWAELGCVIAPGKAVNLPGGELITSPDAVNGVLVADSTLGDADGKLGRDLAETPLTFHIASSRVTSVESATDQTFARDLSLAFARTTNLNRVAIVGFGLNVGLTDPVGDVATDQKLPGLHLSFGETLADITGASWTSKSWIGLCLPKHDVDIDKVPVIRNGRYIV